jgi:isoleucyl-tRNA synthetase
MPVINKTLYDPSLEQKWDSFNEVRDEVLKALEEARKNKVIGNSLSASLHLYPNAKTTELLAQFNDLDNLFIVSKVTIHPSTEEVPADAVKLELVSVSVKQAEGEKCERCWNVTPEVGEDKEHPALCRRCSSVVQLL